MIDETPIVRGLHEIYTQFTGLRVRFDFQRMTTWNNWRSHSFTSEDLKLVIRHLKGKIIKERKWPSSLFFNNLIGRPDLFEEELAEARAMARVKPVTERDRVLQMSGRPRTSERPQAAQTAGDVLAGAKAFADFRAWRQQNGI